MKHILISTFFLLGFSSLWAQTLTDKEKLEKYHNYLVTKKNQINLDKGSKSKKEDSLSTFTKKLQKVEQKLAGLVDSLESTQKNLRQTTTAFDENKVLLKNKKEQLVKSQENSQQIQSTLSANQDSLTSVKSKLQTDKSDLNVHKTQLKSFEEKVTIVNQKITTNKNEIDTKTQSLGQKQSQIQTTANDLTTQKSKLSSLKSKQGTIDSDIGIAKNDVNTQYSKIASLHSQSTTTDKAITQHSNTINSLNTELQTEVKELNEIKKKIQSEEQRLKSLDLSQVDLQNNQLKLKGFYEKEAQVKAKVSSVSSKIGKQNTELANNLQKLETIHKERKLASNTISLAHKQLAALKEEKASLVKNIQNVQAEVTRLETAQSTLTSEVQQLKADTSALLKKKLELKKENDWVTVKRNEEKDFVTKLTESVKALTNRETQLNTTIEQQTNSLNSAKQKVEKLNTEIPALDQKVQQLSGERQHLENQEKALEVEIKKTNKEIETTKGTTSRLKDEVYLLNLNATIATTLLEGIEFGLKGQLPEAIKKFEQAAKEEDRSRDPYFLSAYSFYVARKFENALTELDKSIGRDPKFLEAYFLQAEVNEARGHYIGAIKIYNRITEMNPNDMKPFEHRGRIYYDFLMEWDLACENWDKAITLGSTWAKNEKQRHCNIPLEKRRYRITQITKKAKEPTYGFSTEQPIAVGRKNDDRKTRRANIEAYLDLLRDDKGNKVKYVCLGSCCPYETDSHHGLDGQGLVERYQVTYRDENGKKQTKLMYFSHYEYEKPLLPVGLKTTFEVE
ncbi:MAG: hypothetical protein GY827_10820 [Cytophagales bacterium]|nr:hypothetical protein [Cytophagales bacterium]